MSRTIRAPYVKICSCARRLAGLESFYKRLCRRRMRHEPITDLQPDRREHGDVWSWPSDGKMLVDSDEWIRQG